MRSAAARRPSSAPRWEGPRNGPRNRPQSPSITGCAFRFGVRGKLRPGIYAQTGIQFPDGAGFGKRVPLWGLIPGWTFRMGAHLETASRSVD